ncbi:MAG: DMT family transporter [Candidatus Izemoplasma sp.]
MKNKNVVRAEMMLVVVTIIWGLGFPITDIALESGFGTNTIMVGRFLTASILLTAIYYKKIKEFDKKTVIYGAFTGIFLFLGFYYQTLGNAYTTPTKNGFITQLNIIFVPFLYYLFFRKRVSYYNMISVLIAISGLFVLTYSSEGLSGINIGDFYTFICAIMIAFHVVTSSYYQKKYDLDPVLFTLANMYIAMIFSIVLMFGYEEVPAITLGNIWPLIILGVFNTAFGFLVQSYALKISHPTRVSLIVALESLFGAVGSVLIVNDILTINIVIGGMLIISAILVTELKPFNKHFIVKN